MSSLNDFHKIPETCDTHQECCQFCEDRNPTKGYTDLEIVAKDAFGDFESQNVVRFLTCVECLDEIRLLNEDMEWFDGFGPQDSHRYFSWRFATDCSLCGDELGDSVRGEYETFGNGTGELEWDTYGAFCEDCCSIMYTFFRGLSDMV